MQFLKMIFLCMTLNSCTHVNFLYKCSRYSVDQIGDHKINCPAKERF